MGNWTTLNKGVTASTKDAVEIQVERLLETYQQTLKCHQKGQIDQAKEMYQQLVSQALVKKEPKSSKKTGANVDLVEESPLSTLRFLVFKNYATLLEEEFYKDSKNTDVAGEALKYYLQAVKIDPTEYTLWYHIGQLSHALRKLRFARLAYETGVYVDSNERILKLHALQPENVFEIIKSRRFTPMQWKCLEGLCKVLYEIGDYCTCKLYIAAVMDQVKDWSLGLELLEKIEQSSHFLVNIQNDDVETGLDEHKKSLDVILVNLEKPSWSVLIKSLLKEYKNLSADMRVEALDEQMDCDKSPQSRLTNTSFINRLIHIDMEAEEEEEQHEENPMQVDEAVASLTETVHIINGSDAELEKIPTNDTIPKPTEELNDMVDINTSDNSKDVTVPILEDKTDVEMPEVNEESTLKRKREEEENDGNNSENGEDSENDEDEAEEKRLSLRASKRQREKIANEETSRLKMLEEETQFTKKIQDFYDKVESIPEIARPSPWYECKTKKDFSLCKFWEWFDNKISELDSSYCWDVETRSGSKNNSNLFGDPKQKNLTLFSKSTTDSTEANQTVSSAVVKGFIYKLNISNSGIVDSLCSLIQEIVKNDSIDEHNPRIPVVDNELLELIIDVINALGITLVDQILSNKTISDLESKNIIARICEYLMDQLIRANMTVAEESCIHTTSSSHGRKRISTSLTKSSKLKAIESLIEQCQYWINLLERVMFGSYLDIFISELSEKKMEEPITLGQCKSKLRYLVLKGKLAQCTDDIEGSYSWYTKCRELLEASNQLFKEPITIDLKSMYDSKIDLKSIQDKLSLLHVGKLFATSKQKLTAEDFEGVIEDLEPTVKSKLGSNEITESNEVIQMIDMLATAYVKMDRNLDAWNCYMRMFCLVMKQLVSYGENSGGSSLSYLSKNEDTRFIKLLSQINSLTDNMISLIQDDNSEDWLPRGINKDLADNLVILLRMSIYYTFRHSDYVPFVNNFTNPEVPVHRPSKITRSSGFNSIVIKAWVLQSHLCQRIILGDGNINGNELLSSWAKLLHDLHDDLGEREICGAANNVYLNHLMNTLIRVNGSMFRKKVYQCYHCIYGVHTSVESHPIEEHHCAHIDLDQKASEALFALVVDSCVEKLGKGSLLKLDLKDVIEAISELFEDLPLTNPLVKINKDAIESYLNSDIELNSSLDQVLRTSIMPITDISAKKSGISLVYYRIFWIRGKTLRIQYKNRARVISDKTKADLKNATEEFMSHLVLSPNDADGWCELGTCFQQLAEEELNWSASNIQANKEQIGEYQKKACHAFLRSLYLADSQTEKALAKNELFINFGNLLYSIASAPMKMEALKPQSTRRILKEDGTVTLFKAQQPSIKTTYKLALILYNKALRFKIQDNLEWRCYYMTGKCLAKIGRPPREVIDWYIQTIKQSKFKKSKQDQQFEPIYIFCSYLVKYLYNGKLEAKDVLELLAIEKAVHKNPVTVQDPDQDVIFVGTSTDIANSATLPRLPPQSAHLPLETAHAYNAVFQRLLEIRGVDSKSWQHRAIYRMSWMYFHIYHDVEKAKQELLKLFNLRVITKTYITIWKQGFELPGKHYEYISKYTLFLIDLAKESNDTQTLKHLYRKLRRAQNMVLHDKKVYQQAYRAYLEIINTTLRNTHHAKVYMKMIKESKIEKSQFEALCSPNSISTQNTESELHSTLQDLSELKRLTQGFITGADAEDDGLDKTIRMCYAALVFGGDSNEEKRNELRTAVHTNGEDAIESKSRKDLRLVLLAQAKVFMQNLPPSK